MINDFESNVVISPQCTGILADNVIGNSDAQISTILTSVLCAISGQEIRCEYRCFGGETTTCDVYLYQESHAIAKALERYLLSIPTMNDHGEYDGKHFLIRHVTFWLALAFDN